MRGPNSPWFEATWMSRPSSGVSRMKPGLSAYDASLRELQLQQAEDHDLRVFTRPRSN
jgi:hypothetical protein